MSRDQQYKLSQMDNNPQFFDSKQQLGIFINSQNNMMEQLPPEQRIS